MALSAEELPREQRLERVIEHVHALAHGTSRATRDRYEAARAASILGWVFADGTLTDAGIAVAYCEDASARLLQTTFALEASPLGRAWLRHACVTTLDKLGPDSVRDFLHAEGEMLEADRERRRTIRRRG